MNTMIIRKKSMWQKEFCLYCPAKATLEAAAEVEALYYRCCENTDCVARAKAEVKEMLSRKGTP